MIKNKKLRSNTLGYIFVTPVVFILVVFIGIPMISGILNAFQNIHLTVSMEKSWAGFDNFKKLLVDPIFYVSVKNSLIFVFGSVLFHIVIGFVLALMLDRDIKGKALFRTISILPWAMSGVAVGIIWTWLYHPQFSPINKLLMDFNIIKTQIVFLENPRSAFTSVFIAHNWRNFPFAFIVILSGLQMIPKELYESADIDGASAFQKFFKITIPQMLSVVLTVALLDLMWTFVYFDLPWIMTQGGPVGRTHLMPTYVYENAFKLYDFGKAAALSVFIFFLNFILGIAYIYYSKKAEGINE